jgi:hypothetical protein
MDENGYVTDPIEETKPEPIYIIDVDFDDEGRAMPTYSTEPEVKVVTDARADIERRREEALNAVGAKQKESAFEKLKEAKTAEDKLNAIHIIERNVAEGSVLTEAEKKEIQKVKDNFAAEGYEVYELKDKEFNQGMKVIVTNSIPDENLAEGEEIITKTISPQINKDDKMVQTAQIEVTVGTKKGGLTREQWLAEQKKKETRVDKINAKYDAELAALESKPETVDNSEIIKIQENMKRDANESISDCNGKTPALPDGKNLSGKANKYKKK